MEKIKESGEIPVGEKVKLLREEKGLSLKDLADRTGFSTALLSQMENHLVSPSLGTLIQLAKALDINVGDFFGETHEEPYAIVRREECKTTSRFASKEGVNYGYSYASLGSDKKNRHMEPFVVTLEPTTVKMTKTSTHGGEEFIYVLEGEMEVIFGNHRDVLLPGDSIYFESSIPHRVQCHQEKVTKILAVLYTHNS
jgi:transcriptional regulator with XRE-family HTH domain